MKKFICCVLSFVFVFSALNVGAVADDVCTLKVSTVDGAVGKTVVLTVSIENNSGLSGGLIAVEYDVQTLVFESASVPEGLGMSVTKITNDADNGVVWYGFVNSYGNFCEDGELLHLSFKLKTVSNGFASVKIRVDGNALSGSDYKAVDYKTVDGGVTVSVIESLLGINEGSGIYVEGTVVSVPLGMTVGEFLASVTAEGVNCYSNLGQILGESAEICTDGYLICNFRKLRFAARGDINGDGSVTTADYLMLKKVFSAGEESYQVAFVAGDVNADGETNVTDLYTLKLMLIGS